MQWYLAKKISKEGKFVKPGMCMAMNIYDLWTSRMRNLSKQIFSPFCFYHIYLMIKMLCRIEQNHLLPTLREFQGLWGASSMLSLSGSEHIPSSLKPQCSECPLAMSFSFLWDLWRWLGERRDWEFPLLWLVGLTHNEIQLKDGYNPSIWRSRFHTS